MPAHLRTISSRCIWPKCLKVAVVQLFNTANAPMGRYCEAHGDQALDSHQREYEK